MTGARPEIDREGRMVFFNGQSVVLPPACFAAFEGLLASYPRVRPADMLLDDMESLRRGAEITDATLKVQMHHLRRFIAPLGLTVENVRSSGYRLSIMPFLASADAAPRPSVSDILDIGSTYRAALAPQITRVTVAETELQHARKALWVAIETIMDSPGPEGGQ